MGLRGGKGSHSGQCAGGGKRRPSRVELAVPQPIPGLDI